VTPGVLSRTARVVLAALCATLGCATVPAPITAPEPPSAHSFGLTFATDWGFARATILRPDGSTQVISGNGDNSWGESDAAPTGLAMLVPAVASFHLYGPRGDAAFFAGWRQLGVTSRLMLAGRPGGLLSSLILTAKGGWDASSGDAGAGYELILPVASGARLVGRLGFSWGRRSYDLQVPTDLDPTAYHDASIGNAHLKLFRTDGRVETALGVMSNGGHFIVSVQPYWVAFRGPTRDVSCVSCADGVSVLDFTLEGGFAVALTIM
jgi:hypothetical protein